ncbi:probable alpha-galactosidase D [Aspergillus udagawae]|nr:probable alpha-galactosidase D [Aspergillus udagawae]
MESIVTVLLLSPVLAAGSLHPRIDNGLAKTPQMGWNTYNHYSCSPNEAIVRSNAKALVDLGLASLGYRYVTTDCGWSVADRLPNGTLTWNETLFPSGFPAMGRYLHGLGLLFGVYGDSGTKLCGSPPDQAGSLYHEEQDAKTFAEWGVDALKFDNCYSDAATNYPNVNYEPSTSPSPRYEIMSSALSRVGRPILFQICEWGIDFPALWAPALGNSWRIGNDIIPAWRSIFRTLNQAVPNTDFARPGQWPDLDMLFVGNGVFSVPEEQTHFSLWAILKSPLIIGAALKDNVTSISQASLQVLKQKDVIRFNQDSLGVSASLKRRWSDEGYEVWSGPLSGNRTVVAVINWRNESRDLTLDLPDVGLQYAQVVRNIWSNTVVRDVRTSYTARVAGHGTMLLELQGTVQSGSYPAKIFAKSTGSQKTTFESVYAATTSANYTLAISFSRSSTETITITTSSGQTVSASGKLAKIALAAGSNTITIQHTTPIESIQITPPTGTYYANTVFNVTGSAQHTTCGSGCSPVGSKIGYLSPNSNAYASIPATTPGSKYLAIDYINNDVAFSSSWGWGSNSRNLTVSVNDGAPVRLEAPLSGRHSELFSPGKGWWDTATLGVLTSGWKKGENKVVFGNEGGEDGFQNYAADFVGVRVLD